MTKSNPKTPEKLGGFSTLKPLFPYLFKHKGMLTLGTVMVLIGVIISFLMGLAIKFVIDEFPSDPTRVSDFIDRALMVALIAIILSNVVGYVSGISLKLVASRVTETIRCKIFSNIVYQDFSYIENQSTGDMQTRIISDTDGVGGFLAEQIPTVLSAGLMLIAGIIGAFFISLKLTLMVIVCVPVIFLPFLILNQKLREVGFAIQQTMANAGKYSGETFRNIKVVRAFNKENSENRHFSKLANNVVNAIMRAARLRMGLSKVVETLAMSGFALLLWTAGNDIYAGTMTFGQLLSFTYFALMIVQSAGRFIGIVASINVAIGTAKKVTEYLDFEPAIWSSTSTKLNMQQSIVFKNIAFSYPNRPENEVIRGINFEIKAGQQVALVGSSGAGKSTIFELMLRFHQPTQGQIEVDGVDIQSLDSGAFRSFMSYVPQKESLISGTVMDNIRYGNENADEQQVKAAAKMAHADEFIEKLPNGYNTNIGEVGGRLSGGQKQRISLARAFIRDPQVLLLDEAKSGLDTQSERLVSEAILQWAKLNNATVLTITHSLETVQNADVIIVLDNGLVVDKGTHQQLLKTSPMYQKLSFDENEGVSNGEGSSIA